MSPETKRLNNEVAPIHTLFERTATRRTSLQRAYITSHGAYMRLAAYQLYSCLFILLLREHDTNSHCGNRSATIACERAGARARSIVTLRLAALWLSSPILLLFFVFVECISFSISCSALRFAFFPSYFCFRVQLIVPFIPFDVYFLLLPHLQSNRSVRHNVSIKFQSFCQLSIAPMHQRSPFVRMCVLMCV